MDSDERVRFVSPNFASDYITGALKLPKAFCDVYGEKLPVKVQLHVPTGLVWNGIFKNQALCIQGLEKMMSFYYVKPYHVVLFEYMGGSNFNLKIFNPDGVEINYNIVKNCDDTLDKCRNLLKSSDFEMDKLCGTLSFNSYNSFKGVCDVVLKSKHLHKADFYKVLKKEACEKLGIVEEMEYLKLTFKSFSWVIKLKWENGKLYLDRRWYSFARAGKLRLGDSIVFLKTETAEKFEICVFERNLLSKCNVAGVGQPCGIMAWLKFASLDFILNGEMEIPRIVKEVSRVSLGRSVSIKLPDGESVYVECCSESMKLFRMKELIRRYSIEATDVMIFTYLRQSTFALAIFKFTGEESKYIVGDDLNLDEMNNLCSEDVIILSESSDEENVDVPAVPMGVQPSRFRVTLKPSHVDKRQHGVYCPSVLYLTYKEWTNMTIIRLVCGVKLSFVSVVRSGKMCRFGKGWSEFIEANEFGVGQTLELHYVDDFTFQVEFV